MKFKIKGRRASRNDQLMTWLRDTVKPGSSVLDLGCGPKTYSMPLQQLGCETLTVDAWDWVEPDIVADLEHTDISQITDRCWDYVLMIDFIEHLSKPSGLKLLQDCKNIVNSRIILLTPLPTIWNDNTHNVNNQSLWCYGNSYDTHKSSWDHTDFQDWTAVELSSLKNYFFGYYGT